MQAQDTTKETVRVIAQQQTLHLPFTVILRDFQVAKAAYLERLKTDCVDDTDFMRLAMEMLVYAEAIWDVLLSKQPLFQKLILGFVIGDEARFQGAILDAARTISDEAVQFFEANETDLFWERYEFIRELVASATPA